MPNGVLAVTAMRDQHLRQGHGFIIVYAINHRTSFDSVVFVIACHLSMVSAHLEA
jgi:GTPase SAR1 family protein